MKLFVTILIIFSVVQFGEISAMDKKKHSSPNSPSPGKGRIRPNWQYPEGTLDSEWKVDAWDFYSFVKGIVYGIPVELYGNKDVKREVNKYITYSPNRFRAMALEGYYKRLEDFKAQNPGPTDPATEHLLAHESILAAIKAMFELTKPSDTQSPKHEQYLKRLKKNDPIEFLAAIGTAFPAVNKNNHPLPNSPSPGKGRIKANLKFPDGKLDSEWEVDAWKFYSFARGIVHGIPVEMYGSKDAKREVNKYIAYSPNRFRAMALEGYYKRLEDFKAQNPGPTDPATEHLLAHESILAAIKAMFEFTKPSDSQSPEHEQYLKRLKKNDPIEFLAAIGTASKRKN